MSYFGCPEDFVPAGLCSYRGVECYVLDVYPRNLRGLISGQSYSQDSQTEERRMYGLIGEVRGLVDQSYRWYIGTKDGRLYGIVHMISKKPHIEHWTLDYKEVAPGCWLPMTQGYEIYEMDTSDKSYLDSRRDLKVLEVRINEKLSDELFEMEFKKGVEVVDERFGKAVTYIYEPEPPKLDGKALPELKDLKIELSGADVNDKMILVCFWDMEQRPSRHCISELGKQAEQLGQKGVTVVAVQASKVDKSTLDEFLQKRNISFPVGMIEGDEEKVRFNWGVKSLPWLILIDRKHLVVAEGFLLSELDDKIKPIAER